MNFKTTVTEKDRLFAQSEAYTEAAEHLTMNWTDVELEKEEGLVVAQKLRQMALKCFREAQLRH